MGTVLLIALILLVVGLVWKKSESKGKNKSADQQVNSRRSNGNSQAFQNELDSIPRVQIIPNKETPKLRQHKKDMPEFTGRQISGKTPWQKLFPMVAIDVETTGLDIRSDRIIEVAAIKLEYNSEENNLIATSAFNTLINPEKDIPKDATKIHGITNEMVVNAPTFTEIREQLQEFISGCNLLGHNIVEFDIPFLFVSGLDIDEKTKCYDTLPIAQKYLKRGRDVENHKLVTLCKYYGIERGNAHRSLSDCLATIKVFAHFIAAAQSK